MALEWKHFRETVITLLRVINSAFSLFSRPWCIFGASIFPDVLMRSVWGSICSLIDLPRGFGVVIKTCTAAHVIIKQKFKDLLILRWVGKTALYFWSILCVCVGEKVQWYPLATTCFCVCGLCCHQVSSWFLVTWQAVAAVPECCITLSFRQHRLHSLTREDRFTSKEVVKNGWHWSCEAEKGIN